MDHEEEDEIIELKTHARVTPKTKSVSHQRYQFFKDKLKVTPRQKLKRDDESIDLLSLSWQNSYPAVPVESENALLPVLLRWEKTERGMMRDQPRIRLKEINESCSLHGIQLEQALSLRRHHMKLNNPHVDDMTQLGLGNNNDIYDSEDLFKSAVKKYLNKCHVPFEELDLGENTAPAPDFMLTSPVRLVTYQPGNEDGSFGEHGQINWIEAKMFYGASTIPSETRNGVGAILPTVKKHVENYGPGAFVFLYGCGSELRGQLRHLGISVLDSHPLDLRKMQTHQKKWCANNKGVILP